MESFEAPKAPQEQAGQENGPETEEDSVGEAAEEEDTEDEYEDDEASEAPLRGKMLHVIGMAKDGGEDRRIEEVISAFRPRG